MLLRSTPVRWRLGLVSRPRIAAVLASIAVASTALGYAAATRATPPVADAVMGVFTVDNSGGVRILPIALSEQSWSDAPLYASDILPELRLSHRDLTSVTATGSRSRRGAILSLAVNDSGTIDLFQLEPGDTLRRLTFTRRDDSAPALSPDGTLLAFSTARWNSESNYDLAILELTSGRVQQLTSGDDVDGDPAWSPDGTLLAFTRRPTDRGALQLCVLQLSAVSPSCSAPVGFAAIAGWLDASRILLLASAGDQQRLVVLRLADGSLDTLSGDWNPRLAIVSPDGRWVACTCAAGAADSMRLVVFPADRPSRYRSIAVSGSSADTRVVWLRASTAGLLHSIRIQHAWGNAIAGEPHQLVASAVDSLGRALPGVKLHWSVGDSTAADLDGRTGIILPKRPGTLVVRVSANGLTDSTQLRVREVGGKALLSEDWSDTTLSRWFRFGWPDPLVVEWESGRAAFLNNGDGSFSSGVISQDAFELTNGLAVDFVASTPAQLRKWQHMEVQFLARLDRDRLSAARGINTPPFRGRSVILCDVAWPWDSYGDRRMLTLANATVSAITELPARILSGRWIAVRVQLLPDGRCGVSFDGEPMFLLSAPAPWSPTARVEVSGNSHQTRMLVGPLRVISGVPNDIDWSRARLRGVPR